MTTQICYSQKSGTEDLIAKIKKEQTENVLSLSANVQNLSSLYFDYNYLLLVKKTNSQKNLSINRQGGKFTLEPQESKVLSKTRINTNNQSLIQAFLYIRDEDKNELIAKDSLIIKSNTRTKPKQKEPELLLSGMIINHTKTKFGKDFYDDLFSKYNQFSKKFNFVITISEHPFRGMTTAIEVKANRDIVYKFFSNPDEEYRERQVSQTLKSLWRYKSNH